MKDPAMMQMQMTGGQGMTPEAQMAMAMKQHVEECRNQDLLFEKAGVEQDQVLYTIEQLELEKDPEFMRIAQEMQFKMMAMVQQAQGGGMGGG